MIYYLLAIFLPFIGYLFFRTSKKWQVLVYVYLVLFLCTGYMCGTDWPSYEAFFYETVDFTKGEIIFEPGFTLLNDVFRFIGVDFWAFTIVTKFILLMLTISFIKKHTPKELFFFALTIYVGWFSFYLFIDYPCRNLIAITIFLYSIKYIIRDEKWKYLLFTLLAVSFHYSALIMVLFWFIAKMNLKTKSYVWIFIIANILFVSDTLIFRVLKFLFSAVPAIAFKLETYSLENSAGGFSLGMIVHLLLFVILIKSRHKFVDNFNNGLLIFNLAFCYFVLYRIGLSIDVFYRFQLYVATFLVIALATSVYSISVRNRAPYLATVFLVVLMISIKSITSDYRYIPYSSYLYHKITGEEYNFDYRFSYNRLNSPYKND